jgi:hypothetical protein
MDPGKDRTFGAPTRSILAEAKRFPEMTWLMTSQGYSISSIRFHLQNETSKRVKSGVDSIYR